METINLNSRVSLCAGLDAMEVDDAIIISGDVGGSYGLEMIARRIWELLTRPTTVAELCEVLLGEYDIDRETCERDVLAFLHDSARESLIQTTD